MIHERKSGSKLHFHCKTFYWVNAEAEMGSKQDRQPTPEQRNAFRFPVTSLEQEAVLKIGWSDVPVRLINESAGGLAAQVDRLPKVQVDDVVRLRTSAGQIEAKIAHITKERSPDGDVQANLKQQQPPVQIYRIGLERLEETEPWEHEKHRFGLLARLRQTNLVPSPVVLMIMLITTLLVGMIFPIVMLASLLYFDPPLAKRVVEWSFQQMAAINVEDQIPGLLADSHAPQSLVLGHLPEATALLSPKVGKKLSLSEPQQRQMRQIVQVTNDALRQIDRHDKSSRRFQTRAALCKEARRQMLDVLTPEQQARWKELQGSGL